MLACKQGFLTKAPVRRGFGRRTRRWIELYDEKITWSVVKHGTPKGCLPLDGASVATLVQDGLEVRNRDGLALTLSSKECNVIDEWHVAVREVISKHERKVDGTDHDTKASAPAETAAPEEKAPAKDESGVKVETLGSARNLAKVLNESGRAVEAARLRSEYGV